MKNLLRILPFAFLLHRCYFSFISKTAQMGVIGICVLLYLCLNLPSTLRKHGSQSTFIISCLIFFSFILLSIIISIAHGTGDFSFTKSMLAKGLPFICWLAFSCHVSKKATPGKELETFASLYGYISLLYVAFTVLCLALPPLKSFWASILDTSEVAIVQEETGLYITRFGWAGFSGFFSTHMMTLGVLLCVTCLSKNTRTCEAADKNQRKKYFVYIGAMLVGNFCYGRSGLVISCFILIIYWLRDLLLRGRLQVLIYILFLIFLGGATGFILYENIPSLQPAFHWVLQPVERYLAGQGLSSSSTDSLLAMAQDTTFGFETLLWGDGYYTTPGAETYYKQVDIGYYRLILFGGIFFTAYVLLSVLSVLKKTPLLRGYMSFVLILSFAIFEFKGEVEMTMFILGVALAVISPKIRKTISS